ncbi:MAG: TIGR00282 family metallophosphoesterase, partial [Gemmataceae bacterium]
LVRLLFLGDIVGTPGVEIVRRGVPWFRTHEQIDVVIANAENASGGSGLSPNVYRQLRAAGVDAITLGDHIYKKFDLASLIDQPAEPIVKPANFPPTAPGKPFCIFTAGPFRVGLLSLMGRTFMRPVDCPFTAADRVLAQLPTDLSAIIVDVHAEATADKYLLGNYLAGRVSAVLGTHTHIPTADEQIFHGGTAFQCDVGMTGPYASILGRRVDRVLEAAIHFIPTAFDVATEDVRLCGAIIEIDDSTRKATSIRRVQWTGG